MFNESELFVVRTFEKQSGPLLTATMLPDNESYKYSMNQLKDVKVDDKEFVRIEAMISSMTKEERKNPKLLNGNRRLRIARGSGTTVQDINKFMKSFEMTQKMMRKMQNEKNLKKMMKGINPNDLKGMLK